MILIVMAMAICVDLALVDTVSQSSGTGLVESYVEFDFAPMPRNGEGDCSYTLTVLTKDKDLKYVMESKGARKFDPEVTCAAFKINLEANKFKAEVVDKTKLRVYGRIFNDKLIPATKGTVESSDLKPEELPKVTNPGSKG